MMERKEGAVSGEVYVEARAERIVRICVQGAAHEVWKWRIMRVEGEVEESVDLKDSSEVISVRDAMLAGRERSCGIVVQMNCGVFDNKFLGAQVGGVSCRRRH